ncbi:MAG: hypothetical protein ACJ0Q9_05545 [Gammaproteobacteria bacterium]
MTVSDLQLLVSGPMLRCCFVSVMNGIGLKLYGGKVIDVMQYFPMANPLGWDYSITATVATWRELRDGTRPLGHLLDTGSISIDGNLLQANRLYECTHVMLTILRDL